MKKILLFIISGLSMLPAAAQEFDREQWLEEVEIVGIPPEKYAAGSKIETIDSTAQAVQLSGSLSDLLAQNSSLYFKEYGHGMLSTVSFRGTSASHTAVLWHGLNINSLTLGSTDFSNLPVFMFEAVAVHYGSGSAWYGSDAIGGSIVLHAPPLWTPGYSLQFVQTLGSFGQNFSGLKSTYGNGKWEGKTTTYYLQTDNNFAFKNTARYGQPRERQQNAGVQNYGILQEAGYRFSSRRYVYLHTWYEQSRNDIQPVMGNNLKPETYEHIRDRHLRSVIEYHQLTAQGHLSLMAGFVNDQQLYNRQAPIATSRLMAQATHEQSMSRKLTLKAGGSFQYIVPEVAYYEPGITQRRYDLFASLRYLPYTRWQLSLNARQAFVTGFRAPLAPSLGSAWTIYQQKNRKLLLKNQVARSYRVPTFNDLYWEPGGNSDLRPENGWSTEGGLQYSQSQSRLSWTAEATYYRLWVDDWILWTDAGSYWSPQNMREVEAQGIELSNRLDWKGKRQQFSVAVHYAFTQSENRKALSAYDRSAGKQLPYTPLHRAAMNVHYQWRQWFVRGNTSLTSKRFLTTTNESFLQGYTLVNLYAGKTLPLGKLRSNLTFQANNLLNTRYQNVSNRAMPGRNYQISLQIHFSHQP